MGIKKWYAKTSLYLGLIFTLIGCGKEANADMPFVVGEVTEVKSSGNLIRTLYKTNDIMAAENVFIEIAASVLGDSFSYKVGEKIEVDYSTIDKTKTTKIVVADKFSRISAYRE